MNDQGWDVYGLRARIAELEQELRNSKREVDHLQYTACACEKVQT